ncbi:MAG: Fe-S cluster assembly protein SufD [Acidimicrobiales bacterium]
MSTPQWLVDRRSLNAQEGDFVLPSAEEEVWRYSRVADVDLASWSVVADRSEGIPPEAAELLRNLGHLAGSVVVRNGAIVSTQIDEALVAKGVYLGSLVNGPDAEGAFGSVSEGGPDAFARLNDANFLDGVFLNVPAGVTINNPIAIIDWIDSDGAAVYPRLVVRVGADADVRILDWHGSADVAALVSPLVELDVDRAGRLAYGNVQLRGPRVWQIASQVSRVQNDATLVSSHAGLGCDYGRMRTDCRLVGRGATGNLSAVYFGHNTQTLDFRTFQHHDAPNTNSNLLFKGAVGGHSRSVYTGLIRVEKDARGTNAFQTNRNLKLSDTAWAESVPNLEIETNDVKCSHASTVGPVDEEQTFYLESRGVPTEIAERLIVAGFFDEVLEEFPIAGAVPLIASAIDERLDAGVK